MRCKTNYSDIVITNHTIQYQPYLLFPIAATTVINMIMINQHLHTKLILLAIVVAVVLPHSEAFQSSLSSSCLSIRTSHLLRAEEQWTGEVVAGKWIFCMY